jgi:hypothetical protein
LPTFANLKLVCRQAKDESADGSDIARSKAERNSEARVTGKGL